MALHPRRATPRERMALSLLERTGLIPPELTDYFVWCMSVEQREREDRRPIQIDAPMSRLLAKLPAAWVHAIALHLNLSGTGRKADKIRRIVDHLQDPKRLRETLLALSIDARLALDFIVREKGWASLQALEQEFGTIAEDGAFWVEQPPASTLGQLRVRGLLFIGRARVGRSQRQVAVIPRDLREPMAECLKDPSVLPHKARSRTATTRALERLETFYLSLRHPVLLLEDLQAFLREVAPKEALEIVEDVEDLLIFMEWRRMGSPEDLASHHLSLWMHFGLRRLYIGEVPLKRKRRMPQTTDRLYQFLAHRGRVMPITASQIHEAVARMIAPARELDVIPPPPPLGGEIIMILQDPKGRELPLTMNDRWLTIACAAGFEGNWGAMWQEAASVQDGARKQKRIEQLRTLPQHIWTALLEDLSEEEMEFVREWFYQHEMSELSAW